ncbi:DNA topoisomerase I, partial [Candidatus Marinamargulisbacteria bacterium SCGC AG-414-C22]
TDSTRISDDAKAAAKQYITDTYSEKYLAQSAKKSSSKKNIQDAHEAVRPVYISHKPQRIENDLTSEQFKLYKLIWDRFIASQMANADIDRTQITTQATHSDKTYFLKTIGNVTVFDGFTRIYLEGKDDADDSNNEQKILPAVLKNDDLTKKDIEKEQKFTQPPPRFTEASLVKELEEQGIGRPSTYAPTMSVIQDRGYVGKEGKKLHPTDLGKVVNEQLENYFENIIDVKFTADMETRLDHIQDGKDDWKAIVETFYSPLESKIKHAYDHMEKVNFGERSLGIDPESGKEVLARIGRFGPMIQIGRAEDLKEDEKPKFAGLLKDQELETITLEEALDLFQFPKTVGSYEDADVTVNLGKYGPYVKINKEFVSIPAEFSPASVSLDDAIKLIQEKREKDKNKTIHLFDQHDPPISVLNGPYGPYISMKKRNYRIPKDTDPKTLTVESCLDIIKNQPKRGKKKK